MNPVGFTKAWIPKKIGVDKIGAYEVTPPRSARSQGRSQRAALGFRGQKWWVQGDQPAF